MPPFPRAFSRTAGPSAGRSAYGPRESTLTDGIMAFRIGLALWFMVAVAPFVLGCKRSEPRERAASSIATGAAATGQGTTPGPPAETAPAKEQTAKVEALVDEWLRAQNAGDFPAYEAVYAQRFTGVKRVGVRSQRFDREGWMQDRKALFARPFSVRLEGRQVSALGTSAIVEFQQTWSSASFRDVGRKQLVLALEGSAFRIASEEMKESSTDAAPDTSGAPNPREFAFVALAPGPLLILSADVDQNAVAGQLKYVTDELARRPVATSALPKATRDMLGTKFILYGDGASVCEGTVGGFEVLVSLHPHFGTLGAWHGQNGRPVASPEERALELWAYSAHGAGRFLVAHLDSSSTCEGARWARSAELPKPALWSSRAPTTAERVAVLEAARATPLHRQLQKDFEQAFKKATPWDDSGAPARLVLFEDGLGQSFAGLTASSGADDSCASPFDADAFFLLQKRGASWAVVSAPPELHVTSRWPRDLEPLRADQAFDLEGDGRPEFIGWMDFIRESAGAYRSVLNRSPAYFDCPC
jgi:ketosteroid isomerase-like protein